MKLHEVAHILLLLIFYGLNFMKEYLETGLWDPAKSEDLANQRVALQV